eukprot:jgi/Undpi1/12897/HiC_scaffold_7.g02563.m1
MSTFQHTRCVGLMALSCSIMLLSGGFVSAVGADSSDCNFKAMGDGVCDTLNNNAECGYDGGDCCECTCIVDSLYPCDEEQYYECLDPNAPCHGYENFAYTEHDEDDYLADIGSYYFSPCTVGSIGDGECDNENNSEECGYDGGDCCECACVSTTFHDCGVDGFSCLDPNSGCALVEAGTKTTITASANAYDVRPGAAYSNSGCMEDGCTPGLTRDGETDDTESRWSCIPSIVANGELCEIDFMFENPQDIVEVKVAFWKGDERTRTLEATINGEVLGLFDSYPGSVFNTFGIEGSDVYNLGLKSVGDTAEEWISLLEVNFMVEA